MTTPIEIGARGAYEAASGRLDHRTPWPVLSDFVKDIWRAEFAAGLKAIEGAGYAVVPKALSDDAAWAVCRTVHWEDDGECERCPAFREFPPYGTGTQGCRGMISEVYQALLSAAPPLAKET